MYYLQSRYYDPEIGRFINADVFTSTGQGLLGNNMFAYCRNNPVFRIDISGTFDEDCGLDDPDALDPIQGSHGAGGGGNTSPTAPGSGATGGHAANGGVPSANSSGGSRWFSFKTEGLLESHFSTHNKDFGNAFASKEEYLETANYVIQNGQYLNDSNAYVKFYGYQGHANYAYVGLTRDMQHITTFHLRHASKIFEREGL